MSLTNSQDWAVASSSQTTQPGFNKHLRDIVKILLAITAASLFFNATIFATFTSGAATLIIKDGTMASTKNIRWGLLSVIVFAVSLTCSILMQFYRVIDEERAYSMKMFFWISAKFLQIFWAVILSMFLVSAMTTANASVAKSRSEFR